MRLFLVAFFALFLVACSEMPVSQGSLDDQLASQTELAAQAVKEVERGNDMTAIVLATLAGVSSVFTTVGLSRRRRAAAALTQATGSPAIPSLANVTPPA